MSRNERGFGPAAVGARHRSLPASAGKYWAVFRTQLVNSLAYPMDLLGRSLLIVLFMWIFMNLWRVTYGSTGAQSIAGLTLVDTMWYLMMAEAVMLSKRELSDTITEQVKDGSVAYLLNKPFNFILYHFAAGLGDTVHRLRRKPGHRQRSRLADGRPAARAGRVAAGRGRRRLSPGCSTSASPH